MVTKTKDQLCLTEAGISGFTIFGKDVSGVEEIYRAQIKILIILLMKFGLHNIPLENVGFSFCLIIIMKLNYVQISINRTDFVTKHKLLPVNLTWLFQVYGKMFFFPIG